MKKIVILSIVGTLLLLNCQKNKFKPKHFLPELYAYKIQPELTNVESEIQSLKANWAKMSVNSTTTEIENFKVKYVDFLLEIENILFYNIGDVNSTYVYGRFYKADIDTDKLWTIYNDATYFYVDDIQSMINSVKGVNAVEYLLFSPNATDSIQASAKYVNFIDAHLDAIQSEITAAKTSWSVYQPNFETMTDKGIKGSYNMVVNQIIHGLEEIVIKKIGDPLENTTNLSQSRLKLINQSIEQRYNVYMGNGVEQFNSVYNHVRKKDKKLANAIQLDFENLIEEGKSFNESYDFYFNVDQQKLITFRDNVKALMLKFKIEVISLIDVTLTIGDSDGD